VRTTDDGAINWQDILLIYTVHPSWGTGETLKEQRVIRNPTVDNVAEWLRRWIANPLLFERVSSNLTVVGFTFLPVFVARLHFLVFDTIRSHMGQGLIPVTRNP
jgi:hypothetical protein